ncbi:MAG: radical SAM protein [Planctomycetaceae bacterium]|nr:radical SAM protein [Planctomycetaceae bacterium]
MAKILLINPNKWGRGITPIWIASHAAALQEAGHEVDLFDATFFRQWTNNELAFNTANLQYRPTPYEAQVEFCEDDVHQALQEKVELFQPDLLFWSAISSHIHGEGEYVNLQYGYDLIRELETNALRVAAGLQATAAPQSILDRFPHVDFLIAGESDLAITQVASAVPNRTAIQQIQGVIWRDTQGQALANERQPIISDLDAIGTYDYTLFDPQVLLRPYNGRVVKGVDYELSRGCIFTCSYCVETVIQKYYGANQSSPTSGALLQPKKYLRNKSAARIMEELTFLHVGLGVELIRCQDTNFMTINRSLLKELAARLEKSNLDIKLYIETRADHLRDKDFPLLKRLKVDGIGTGIELSSETFREDRLNRHAATDRLVENFALLREHGIRRTTYNIIGLPQETEAMILDTIRFNQMLEPDNITVAFYSPYLGTPEAARGEQENYFDDYEYDVDGQLRTCSKSALISPSLLEFYKANFVTLVRDGLDRLDELKQNHFAIC